MVAKIYIHRIFFVITLSIMLFLHTTASKADISQFIEENYNSSYVEPSGPEIDYNTFDPSRKLIERCLLLTKQLTKQY